MKKFALLISMAAFVACQNNTSSTQNTKKDSTIMTVQKIKKEAFGKDREGDAIDLYTLSNKNGMTVKIMNFGATITSIQTPDNKGVMGEVALGFDKDEDYFGDNYWNTHPYFGAIVGRYGNRIKGGKFTLDGKTYTLAKNNGNNHLHGGMKGFDRVVWTVDSVKTDAAELTLHHVSKDGEEGYPGEVKLSVTYTLTDDNELKISYLATTNKVTPLNVTNHTYFNLNGATDDVLKHELEISANEYTKVDGELIPIKNESVKGTAFDFTTKHAIGERIAKVEGGYDHNFVFNRKSANDLETLVTVHDPASGRTMEVSTTEPGVQFYTGNFLKGNLIGHGGKVIKQHYGFCLETQHFPDSPNQKSFPSTILKPNETYKQLTIYKFSAK